MISQSRAAAALGFLGVSALLTLACERVPLLAPSGSTITLTATTTVLSFGGTTQIVAQVIEAAGTPPHSGTHIIFTTTLGTVQPSEVETNVNGQAVVTFNAGTASGTASISAASGGANVGTAGVLKILVGTAAVGKVIVSASPALVPALGGSSTITAVVLDVNGNALTSAPVTFSTTAGVLSASLATTNQAGAAQTVLTTSTQAIVTASVGAGSTSATPPTTGPTPPTTPTSGQASGNATVGILSAPTLVITPPTTATVGFPASFTFVVTVPTTNGSAVKDVTVNWGDGSTSDLGAITGSAIQSHVYRSAGVFVVTATLTDASGNTVLQSTSVSVTAPALALVITQTSTSTIPGAGVPTSFNFVPTVPTGDSVKDVTVDWGDGGAAQDLGAITGTVVVPHLYASAGTYAIKGVLTDVFGNSVNSSTSITVVATPQPTVIVTPTAPGPGHPIDVAVQIQVTTPNGVSIQSATINWNDGGPGGTPGPSADQQLGGVNGTITVHHTFTGAGSFTITVTVKDTLGRSTSGTASVTIS